jgi:maleylacetoacetate isomerase
MKLYSYWRSLATFRVRIALNLKNVGYESIEMDLERGDQHRAEFRLVNPQMVVPALIEGDGTVLCQSLAIMEYLDEVHPEPPLLPPDPKGRARVRALSLITVADSHPLVTPRVRGHLQATFGLDDARRMAWARHWFDAGLDAYEAHLARGTSTGAYCHGDCVTMADLCLVSHAVGYTAYMGGELGKYPTAKRIVERCLGDDRFARAHPLRQPGAPH